MTIRIRALALIGAMSYAACVPPSGTWSSQPRWQGPPPGSAQAPSSRVGYADYNNGYASGSTVNGYGPAQTSNQPMDSNCSWVCRRISECGFMSYDYCGEICAGAAANGQPLSIGNESCA